MLNRQELWERMKKYGMTQSTLKQCPLDADLKLIIQHNTCRCPAFFKVLWDEGGEPPPTKKEKKQFVESQMTPIQNEDGSWNM